MELCAALSMLALGGCLAEEGRDDLGDQEADRLSYGAELIYDGSEGQADALSASVCTQHGYQDSTGQVFAGSKSQRFELRPNDPVCKNKYRAELQVNDIEAGEDYWYGFALYVPSSVPKSESFTFWQIHGRKDDCESWRNPPAALALADGESISARHTWDDRKCSTNGVPKDHRTTTTIAQISRDQWHEFVIHLRMDHDGGGVFEVWQDGNEVYDFEGPLGFDDTKDPYLKWGMYSYSSPVASKAVTYMDQVRVVKGGTYDDVAPSGGGGSGELVNLALRSDIWGPDNTQEANPVDHLVDGDESTRWSAQGFPKAVVVDLGEVTTIRETRVVPHQQRPYRYVIKARKKWGHSWTEIVDRRSNGQWSSEFVDDFADIDARFVRLEVVGVADDVTSWSSIREFEVFGD